MNIASLVSRCVLLLAGLSVISGLLTVGVAAGTIGGTVTEAATGDPIPDLRIQVYDSQWQFQYSDSTWTAADGTFETGDLETGSYYVRTLSIYPQPWISEYWFDSRSRDTAVPVSISAGEPVIGIDFQLDGGGYLRGEIRDDGGYPLVDLDIDLYEGDWSFNSSYTDRTDDDGRFVIGPVPPGTWYVRADPDRVHGVCQAYWPAAWYREQAQPLAVAAHGDIPGVDFTLVSGGMISGTVIEQRNLEPREDLDVVIYSPEGIEQPIHSVSTDGDGHYTAYGLPEGGYKVLADASWGCGARDTFFPAAAELSGGSTVMVDSGIHVEGIDIGLPEGNFDLNIELKMPRRWVDPGELFGLRMTIDNDGPELTDLPAFVILDVQGALYFWPSWSFWNPDQQTGLDFQLLKVTEDDSEVEILPEFIWPELGFDMDDLHFMGALTNWSMTGLASDFEIEEWSFDGFN